MVKTIIYTVYNREHHKKWKQNLMSIYMVKTLINTVRILSAVVDKKNQLHCCKINIQRLYNREHHQKWKQNLMYINMVKTLINRSQNIISCCWQNKSVHCCKFVIILCNVTDWWQTRNIQSDWSGDMCIKMSLFIVKWAGSYW